MSRQTIVIFFVLVYGAAQFMFWILPSNWARKHQNGIVVLDWGRFWASQSSTLHLLPTSEISKWVPSAHSIIWCLRTASNMFSAQAKMTRLLMCYASNFSTVAEMSMLIRSTTWTAILFMYCQHWTIYGSLSLSVTSKRPSFTTSASAVKKLNTFGQRAFLLFWLFLVGWAWH